LITSEKTLFPNKAMITDIGGLDFDISFLETQSKPQHIPVSYLKSLGQKHFGIQRFSDCRKVA
jgi:hypothetical protein